MAIRQAGFNLWEPRKHYRRVLWLSDVHVPYHDPAALSGWLSFARDYEPDLIVVGGDFYNFHQISRHPQDPTKRNDDVQSEIDAGRPLIKKIDELGADVVFHIGNHDWRLIGLTQDLPGLHGLKALDLKNAAELPARWDVIPSQGRLRIGSLDFLHGDLKGRGGGAKHVASWMFAKLKRSCIFGHFHRFNTFLDPDGDGVVRGAFAVGHMANVSTLADYCPVNDWVQGFCSVDFDHKRNLFSVSNHIIVDGRFRFGGKTYGRGR